MKPEEYNVMLFRGWLIDVLMLLHAYNLYIIDLRTN